MACSKCEDYGGRWMMTDSEGLKRCDCLPKLEPIKSHPPVLTQQQATLFVEMLASIPFFPSEGGARIAISDELMAICAGPNEAKWLVTRMRRLYQRWPGPVELRRVYASKHVPWDGLPSIGISETYPGGIPSEREQQLALEGPKMLALPPGREVSADPELDGHVLEQFARVPNMPRPLEMSAGSHARRFEQMLEDIQTPPQDRPEKPPPTPQIITKADIDKAVADLRASKGEKVSQ